MFGSRDKRGFVFWFTNLMFCVKGAIDTTATYCNVAYEHLFKDIKKTRWVYTHAHLSEKYSTNTPLKQWNSHICFGVFSVLFFPPKHKYFGIKISLMATSLMCVYTWSKNRTCIMGSFCRQAHWYKLSLGSLRTFERKSRHHDLKSFRASSSFNNTPANSAGYQIHLASLRTSFNSTFSGCPAFNESFAPVFLYQDSCKVTPMGHEVR